MSLLDDLRRREKSDFDLKTFKNLNMSVNLTITYSNSFHSLFSKKGKGQQVGGKQTSIVVIQENRTLVS